MNTVEFVLGSIVAVVVIQIIVTVIIMLKIGKLRVVEEKIKEVQRESSASVEVIYRQLEEENRSRVTATDEVSRNIDECDKEIRNFIADVDRTLRDEIKNSLSDSKSYTDSRIDKLKN